LARFKSGGGGAVQCMLILSVGSPEMTFGPPPQQHRLCAGCRRTVRLGTCAAYTQRTATPPRPVCPSARRPMAAADTFGHHDVVGGGGGGCIRHDERDRRPSRK